MLVQANSFMLPFADNSVQMIFTSPPYYGIRVYAGLVPLVWGEAAGCEHDWGKVEYGLQPHGDDGKSKSGLASGKATQSQTRKLKTISAFCRQCGAWLGHLGNEPDPYMYIDHMVIVGRELRRVLREDGVLVLNLGDTFAHNRGYRVPDRKWTDVGNDMGMKVPQGLKPKDKMMIPQRAALAMQGDGWWIREEIPWIKHNALPGAFRDRPVTGHEYLYFMTKSARYFWDNEAVKRLASQASIKRVQQDTFDQQTGGEKDYAKTGVNQNRSSRQTLENYAKGDTSRRQYRTTDAWLDGLEVMISEAAAYLNHLVEIRGGKGLLVDMTGDPLAIRVPTVGYELAHYATFPPDLVIDFIRGAISQGGACSKCGKQYCRMQDGRFSPACVCGMGPGMIPDDLEVIESPTGEASDDPTMVTGRAGMNRVRNSDGVRAITRYEQRAYARQLKNSPHSQEMRQEAGEAAFGHYARVDRVGARPIPPPCLSCGLKRGGLSESRRPR